MHFSCALLLSAWVVLLTLKQQSYFVETCVWCFSFLEQQVHLPLLYTFHSISLLWALFLKPMSSSCTHILVFPTLLLSKKQHIFSMTYSQKPKVCVKPLRVYAVWFVGHVASHPSHTEKLQREWVLFCGSLVGEGIALAVRAAGAQIWRQQPEARTERGFSDS